MARTGLRDGIDRDVYNIVRKLEDDQDRHLNNNFNIVRRRLTVPFVFESIKQSNSSLSRQKRRPLEEAIERVLSLRRTERVADAVEEDSDAAIEAEGETHGAQLTAVN